MRQNTHSVNKKPKNSPTGMDSHTPVSPQNCGRITVAAMSSTPLRIKVMNEELFPSPIEEKKRGANMPIAENRKQNGKMCIPDYTIWNNSGSCALSI